MTDEPDMNDIGKTSSDSHDDHGRGHVVGGGTLLGTFGVLVVLTAITVTVSRIDLGQMNVVVALAIACTKAAFVAAFFMHLKYEGRFNLVILLSSLAFVVVLVTFVLQDSRTYQPDIRRFGSEHPAVESEAEREQLQKGDAPGPQAPAAP